ncbi:hypothetical protein GCM10009550_75190 [Actinocorallia libanotica]|uniref:Lipoprotein n=2 Tax=Actinocorallia libanotica TaxID=46162 RepID=A0ABN1S036_9ACTN
MLAGCAKLPERDPEPESTSDGREVLYFKDVETMTATADIVVRGHVTEANKVGRWIGPPEGEGEGGDRDQMRLITLAIDEAFTSKIGDLPKEISVEEGYWTADGTGIQDSGVTWSKVGDVGYYFLTPISKGGYRLLNSQGRISLSQDSAKSLDSGELVPTADTDSEIFTQIKELTPVELEEKIEKAEQDLRDGKIEPLEEGPR